MTVSKSHIIVLLAGAFASLPAGSFYSWSVFIHPLAQAYPSWSHASIHANSLVLGMFGVSAAFAGQLEHTLGTRQMAFLGALFTGAGAALCGKRIFTTI